MKKLANRYVPLIVEGIIFVIWNILVWTLADLKTANVYFYCGYGFTVLAFLLAAGVLCSLKLSKHVFFSLVTPAYVATGAYFGITFIMDLVFMCVSKGTNAKAVVIPNVVVVLLYVAAMAVAYATINRIGSNNKVIEQKVHNLKVVVVEIGQIAAITNDSALKKSLMELREAVDYSDPIGVGETASLEDKFSNKVTEIRRLVEENSDVNEIAGAINDAKNKLRERNELLRSLK